MFSMCYWPQNLMSFGRLAHCVCFVVFDSQFKLEYVINRQHRHLVTLQAACNLTNGIYRLTQAVP